eukprot:scaffold1001_cov169-Amphora_coffeaeformis.AAC.6
MTSRDGRRLRGVIIPIVLRWYGPKGLLSQERSKNNSCQVNCKDEPSKVAPPQRKIAKQASGFC